MDTVGNEISPQLLVIELDPAFVEVLLAAEDPLRLSKLIPPFFMQYLSYPLLSSPHPVWTPTARIVRTFRAGVSTLRFLLGHSTEQHPSFRALVRRDFCGSLQPRPSRVVDYFFSCCIFGLVDSSGLP